MCFSMHRRFRVESIVVSRDWLSAIDTFTRQNRTLADRSVERDILRARREAFLAHEPGPCIVAESDPSAALPISPDMGIPVLRGKLDVNVVRATIRAHGSLVVKHVFREDVVSHLRTALEAAFAARDAAQSGAAPTAGHGWYSELPLPGAAWHRHFTRETGGMLAVDSPRALFQCFEALCEAGAVQLAAEYLGTRPAFSVEKTVFRRIGGEDAGPPDDGWHQDGSFMKTDDRVLNIWITLTPCGRTAPSLELLPRRVGRILENDGGHLPAHVLRREYPDVAPVLLDLEPGDLVLFDHLCVHRTGHISRMTDLRLALECWTFAPDNVPREYSGLML